MKFSELILSFSAGSLWLLALIFASGVHNINRRANIWLSLFYGFLACNFTQLVIEGFAKNDLLIYLLELPRWAVLPCFYIALMHYANPFHKSRRMFLHFVPVILFTLFFLIYLLPKLHGYVVPELPVYLPKLIRYFFFVQIVLYWYLSLKLWNRHIKNIRKTNSFTDDIDLAWIKYTLISVLIMVMVRLSAGIHEQISTIQPLMYFLAIAMLAFYTLKQTVIYPEKDKALADLIEKKPFERLSVQQVSYLETRIRKQTAEEKLYLEPGLTLMMLSEKTGVSPHELSYVLNTGMKKNFYQFINELRIEEACRLLISPETADADMMSIAVWAGFNSKTTFYTTFKKIKGKTPLQYQRTA
jgi:AraC-like DNA-binding protein